MQAHLQTEFADAEVKGGREDKVSHRSTDLICVWWPGWAELARDISFANPTLTIRYFPARSRQPNLTTPDDQAPLEQAAVALMQAMAGTRKVGDFVDGLACRIASVTPHPSPDEWFVEADVRAYALNLAASAA